MVMMLIINNGCYSIACITHTYLNFRIINKHSYKIAGTWLNKHIYSQIKSRIKIDFTFTFYTFIIRLNNNKKNIPFTALHIFVGM